jgi:hypothetical protein
VEDDTQSVIEQVSQSKPEYIADGDVVEPTAERRTRRGGGVWGESGHFRRCRKDFQEGERTCVYNSTGTAPARNKDKK